MWTHYRRTFWPMQLFILALCAGGYFFGKMPVPAVSFLWLSLQFGAIAGAWWGSKMRVDTEADKDALPLKGKLR